MNKKNYENPESELITVRFEGNFCATNEDNEGKVPQPGANDIDDEY